MKAICNAMFAIGVSATNAAEAMQAIDLAAKLMTAALGRKITASQVKERMAELLEEWLAEVSTKH